MADRGAADTTASVASVDTTAAPTLAGAAELAWSAEQLQLDDLGPIPPMPRPVEPSSWRAVCRFAIGVLATCVAIAGAITAADRHWFAELRESAPAPLAAPAASSVTPAPTEAVAQPEPWTLPVVPAAEHLVPPAPPPEDFTTSTAEQDALFLAGLTASAIIVYDRNDAINTGHYVCQARAQGYSRASIAALAVSRNPRLSPRDASNMVSAAINAYCPAY